MPRGDKTGPLGEGPGTGGGKGGCATTEKSIDDAGCGLGRGLPPCGQGKGINIGKTDDISDNSDKTTVKMKLSRAQWEFIGQKAGWL